MGVLCLLHDVALAEDTHVRAEKSPPVTESVTTTVKCREGVILSHDVKASAPDVRNVAQTGVDCDGAGCKAWTVTAMRESAEPFDIGIDLVCSGDGKDTEFDHMLEAMQNESGRQEEDQ